MDQLAAVCEQVVQYGSRLKKIKLLADYLRPLSDEDLALAVQFLSSGPAGPNGERLSIGHALLRDAAMQVTAWDLETLRACYHAVGDTGETISKLLVGFGAEEPLTLAEAQSVYRQLGQMRRTAAKVDQLAAVFRRHRPATMKVFIKVITGSLRMGLQEKMLEEAVAAATDQTHQAVREANNRLGNLAQVALAARHGELHVIEARLFHAMDFMLAKPLDALSDLPDPQGWAVEDKYDGIRAQAHFDNGRVALFTRGLEEVTQSYPEVVTALQFVPGSAVLDGELLAWRNGRALAFTVLQQRLARKKLSAELAAEIPVVFMAYDVLYRNGLLTLDQPLTERRKVLEQTLQGCGEPLLLSPQYTTPDLEAVDRQFAEARGRGNEGLLLKRWDSIYEPGRRSGAWLKLKRPYGTLDVVITAAEQGHGKRATMLSDYTFGVRMGDRFVNVGKAYSGLTDPEIRELTRLLKASALERYGRVTLVKPEIVLEVAFDGVQKSPRHKGGFALRFPRILRWRKDKTPQECDDLARVQELYEASLVAGDAT